MKGNKRFLLTSSFIALLFIAVVSSVKLVSVNAQNNDIVQKYKYYTSYQVQPGDTLFSLAKKHITENQISVDDYVEEVKNINNISSGKITAGNNIIIIYYSDQYK